MLNENQKLAVTSPNGPIMVVAGPGSGKTFVIVERINYMINSLNINPKNILVITFTKAAATEMSSRFNKKYNNSQVTFGTFHSIFYKMLRTFDNIKYNLSNLLDEIEKKKIVEKIYKNQNSEKIEDFVELFLSEYSLMKNVLVSIKKYNPSTIPKEIFEKIAIQYENYKENQNLFDFDDMLVECYYLLKNSPEAREYFSKIYTHILVDEFQDINIAQFEALLLLKQQNDEIFVVGDDDQSIYAFRGANPKFLLDFKKYFPRTQTIVLDVNYRSNMEIIKISNNLIKHNNNRFNKVMKANNTQKILPKVIYCKDSNEQVKTIINDIKLIKNKGAYFSDIAIIYRNNEESRPYVEQFLNLNIPFKMRNNMSDLYNHWITKDILAYFKLAYDKSDVISFKRIANKPNRYISKSIIEQIKKDNISFLEFMKKNELADWQQEKLVKLDYNLNQLKNKNVAQGIEYIKKVIGYEEYLTTYATVYLTVKPDSFYDILEELIHDAKDIDDYLQWEENLKNFSDKVKEKQNQGFHDGITLSTMHSAKGLEFEHVYIINAVDEVIPNEQNSSREQIEEERRLLYVALTRAKNHLSIYVPKIMSKKKVKPSPFLEEIESEEITINIGDKIRHKRYGSGIIENVKDNLAYVNFFSLGVRNIDYLFCLRKKLIKFEEGNHEKE
ncbi:hypothetical protein AN641_08670 [Candidatus Epulonipiscioides gigas]|nr:hypothetical protein AN641_08670 [Epulopiscium sp. SCG-C07WGA-EpuloA2]